MAPAPSDPAFLAVWPKCFVTFMAVVEVIAAVFLLLTEVGNVAANFWTANVFGGGWCGLVIVIHFILLFAAGCCSPGAPAAFRAVIVTIIAMIACATLIGFNAYFMIQPTACILTPSCATNAGSNSTFSYNFRTSFYTFFNNWGPFKSYAESQTKALFQSIQIGVSAVCILLCIIYLVLYYMSKNKAKSQTSPSPQLYPPGISWPPQRPPHYAPPGQQQYFRPTAPAFHPPAYVPQAPPGQIPWNTGRRY